MYSRQLEELKKLMDKVEDGNYFYLEPILLKRKKVKSLKEEECIYLGKSMPRFFLLKSKRVLEVIIYNNSISLSATVSSIEIEKNRDISKNRVLLEPRFNTFDISLKEIKLDIFNDISIYIDNKIFAKASLKAVSKGYILKIEELFYE